MNSIKMEINNPSTKIALIPMNKVIKKRNKILKSKNNAKEFVTSFIIPRNINQNQYFRTKENIQFALTTFNDNTLGELGINIFSIGYSVSQTDIQQQKIEYHFQARDFDLADISTIFQMLRILNMDKAYNNLSKYLQRYDQISSIPCSTELEIQKVEELASKYPYECYTFRHERNESVILKYTHNIKFLQLMGITIDMIEEYLRETKTLPCAIRVNNYLEVWHQVFEAVSNDSQIFEMEVQNFNGKRFYVKIKQEQILQKKMENCMVIYIGYTQLTLIKIQQQKLRSLIRQIIPKTKGMSLQKQNDKTQLFQNHHYLTLTHKHIFQQQQSLICDS